jgi:hypothetical protein
VLPFWLIPEQLKNPHVVIKANNIAYVYGFENHYMKSYICALIFIRALHLVGAYLASQHHVVHSLHRSLWESKVVDNLSRKRTKGFLEEQMLSRFRDIQAPSVLLDWLKGPVEDSGLAMSLLRSMMDKC